MRKVPKLWSPLGFSVKFSESRNLGNTTQDLGSWSAQASLSQHSLAWHDFDLAFRNLGSSPLQWLLAPLVPPQHGEFFRGFFSVNVGASQQVVWDTQNQYKKSTPKSPCKKSVQNSMQKSVPKIRIKQIRAKSNPLSILAN